MNDRIRGSIDMKHNKVTFTVSYDTGAVGVYKVYDIEEKALMDVMNTIKQAYANGYDANLQLPNKRTGKTVFLSVAKTSNIEVDLHKNLEVEE